MKSTNVISRDFIQKEKDKWETEGTTTSNELINLAHNKFNNMVATKEWSNSDPKDAVIADLTTRVHTLEGGQSCGSGVNPTKITTTNPFGQGRSGDTPVCSGLENR